MSVNRIVIAGLLLLVLFWPIYGIANPTYVLYLFDVLNALGITIGIPVLWRYAPGAVLAIRDILYGGGQLTKGPLLVLGITETWMAMIMRTVLIWYWRYSGELDSGLDSIGMAFAATLIIPGGICHLMASVMPSDNYVMPKIGYSVLVWSLILGFVLGGGVAALRLVSLG